MNNYLPLTHPKSLSEHRANYLFNTFCDYIKMSEGQTINISDSNKGLASLYYNHLVDWFATVGKMFFSEINNRDSAEFILYINTGISEPSDLQKIFHKDNVHLLIREGETPAFCVDEPTPTEEPTEPAPTEFVTIEVINPEPELPEEAEDDSDVYIGRKKPDYKVKLGGGITRIHNQHIGVDVPKPIKEYSVKVSGKQDYFVLHSGPNTEILCYPVEPGKTIADYSTKAGISASWKDPYMLAIRHDYCERTECKIQDVRKVTYPNWVRCWRAKYLKQTRLLKKEIKQAKKKNL